MFENFSSFDKQDAIQDFRDARRKAAFQSLFSFFSGEEKDLLKFDDIKKQLGVVNQSHQSLEYINIDKIIGSVGRYKDFDRNFLPKNDSDMERWTGVRMAMSSMTGVPPIEVYQIGEVYFVLDGNHRVSAARAMGNDRIEAYVTKFNTPIHFTADDKIDDLLLKVEYADFIAQTKIQEYYPNLELIATVPGRYKYLIENINYHQHYLEKQHKRKYTEEEVIKSWVNSVYYPVIEKINQSGLLRDFPDRTETDLFLWLLKHKQDLEKSLGWQVNLSEALNNFKDRFGKSASGKKKLGVSINDSFLSSSLDTGPEIGSWRKEATEERTLTSLFASILVPLSRNDQEFAALHQALSIAKKENATIRGLIIVDELLKKDDPIYQKMEDSFYRICKDYEVKANLVYDEGQVTKVVCERAVWNDLIVLHLFHPPADDAISRLKSGLREIIQRTPRPILLTPNFIPMNRIMVAYDQSEKSKEALFLAAYFTAMWNLKLYIYTNTESRRQSFRAEQEALQIIERYYINASFIHKNDSIEMSLQETIKEKNIDLLLMGGYSHKPLVQMFVGSTVDHMLRTLEIPILICR
jgi:nucleotide-binding universal stress UspA family protein